MPETPCGEPQGPTEIAPGIFAADLGAASGVPRDWAVLSLCRVGERFANHAVRREVFLIEQDADHNPALAAVVAEAVRTIDAWPPKAAPSSCTATAAPAARGSSSVPG